MPRASWRSIDSIQEGVQSTRRLVLAEELGGVTGRFFIKGTDRRADAQAYDPAFRAWLWRETLAMLGETDPVASVPGQAAR